jgi:molybdopterin-guanine dinucleotide biosynthesis protein A
LSLIHRDAARTIAGAVARGELKLLTVLEAAASELAPADAQPFERVPYMLSIDENLRFASGNPGHVWQVITPAQRSAQSLWFTNLNTPEDFVDAERHANALDT